MLMLAVSSIVMAQKDEVIYDICRAKFGDSFDTTKAALQKYMKDIESSFGSLAGVFPGTSCPEPWVIGDVIRYTHWGHSEKYFTIYDIVFDEPPGKRMKQGTYPICSSTIAAILSRSA